MSGHDLTLGEIDGRGAVFVLPVVSEADSPRAREGIAARRGGSLFAHVAVEHDSDCPAIDPYGQSGSR